MKKDSRSFLFLIISILVISFLTAFVFNSDFVKAVDGNSNLPEVEVNVSLRGLTCNKSTEGVDYNENMLTRVSDVLLNAHNMYTYDSKTPNDLHGTEPGKTLGGDMGAILVDKNGNKVTSLEVTAQIFVNVSKNDVANQIYDNLSNYFTRENIQESINRNDDIVSANYGEYLEKQYKIQINFSEDGKFSFQIPEDVPNDYLLAFTQIEDPLTGEMVDISKTFRLFIALGDGSKSNEPYKPEEKPDTEPDDAHRYHSVKTSMTTFTDMEPDLSASISSSIYDVTEGIPTSENLNYSITADNALYSISTRETTLNAGVKNITIILKATYPQKHTQITYNESGDKIEKTWTTIETLTKTVTKNYSYDMPTLKLYDVPISLILPVQNGSIQAENTGNVLSSGTLGLAGSNVLSEQILSIIAKDPKVEDVEYENLGRFSSKSAAQKALNNNDGTNVKNRIKAAVHAAVSYVGNTSYAYYGLNVTTKYNNNIKPVVAKTSGGSTNMIPSTCPNGFYTSSGTVNYAGNKSFGVKPNNLVVHTPVVNNAYISDVSDFINQKINIDKNRTYLMLDEQFTITIPDNGTHNNIKGYGTRKYNTAQGVTKLPTTWGKIKDIKLPFDAYLHYKKNNTTYKYFVKANTWLSESGAGDVISLTNNTYTFTIPVWATEGTCNIETRVIAENAINSDMYVLAEEGKNSSATNYVATKVIPVEVIGKIYDLRISASNDPGWAEVYSWKNQRDYITADEFPFGGQGQNKVTQYKYAPKLGYTFVFNFKTKGRKSNNIDVSVQPEGFYFVSRDGKKTQEVDLYYNTTTKSNIQILPADTNVNLAVTLRDAMYKVAPQEFTDSTRIYNSKYNYGSAVRVGTFAKMNLPENLRLCYNNFEEYVGKLYGKGSTENSISGNAGARDTVIGSVGHWYAGYRLPASTKAVPKGANINDAIKNKSYLTDGYILVKFDLKTKYKNNSGNYDYLQYMGPEGINEAGDNTGKLIEDWTKDGVKDFTLPNGNIAKVPVGSVAIFEANLRSSNDAEVGGTH